MMYRCRHCGITFNSSELSKCPDCGTKVGMVNPSNLIPSSVQAESPKFVTLEKRRKYSREWMHNHYTNDPEFRRKHKERCRVYNKLHPHAPLSLEAHLKMAEYFREWRKKNPEKVKAYEEKRKREPRLQISQVKSRIRYMQKLLAKLENQVSLEMVNPENLEAKKVQT